MLGDVAGTFEVPGVAYDEYGFEALIGHYFVGFGDVFFGGLGGSFYVNLVWENAIF